MKKLLAGILFLLASAGYGQIIDFAYHLTASSYPLNGGAASAGGTSVGPYSGTPVLGDMIYFNGTNWVSLAAPSNGAYNVTWTTSVPSWTAATAGAPTGATYITQTADAGLSAEQALGALATGFMKSTTTTGVVSTQATIALTDMDTQAATTFVMNNTTGAAAPTAVAVQAAQQALALDTSYAYFRDEMCTTGGVFRSNLGGAAPAISELAGNTAHPCIASLSTGTGTTDWSAYELTDAAHDANFKIGGGAIVVKGSFAIPTASDGTITFSVQAGFFTSRGTFTDGVYIDYTQATSVNWRFCGVKASASSCSTTSVAAADGAFHTFEIDINAAGTAANLLIDGSAAGTPLTGTNIPTASVTQMFEIVKSLGATARTLQCDYWIFYQALTSAR